MLTLKPVKSLKGEIKVPGDKSISHRSVMLGSLAEGTTEIEGFLEGADALSTISCFKKMGVEIEKREDGKVIVKGRGLHGLVAPTEVLDAGNSGTTTRILSGILSGQKFASTITGDASICKRPMKRVIEPLRLMGADICGENDEFLAPLNINKSGDVKGLKAITYHSPVASAQVKSAILLAGLFAEGETSVIENEKSRNHTEIMLRNFGVNCKEEIITEIDEAGNSVEKYKATVTPPEKLVATNVVVPGDISSATYFMVAAAITPGSEVTVKGVGVNETRDGVIRVLKAMGADITVNRTNSSDNAEPMADITVKYGNLKGTEISGDIIPTLIDEIPALAVLACFAEGETVIKDAAELKVKESNRIDTVVNNLKKMGADIEATDDGMIINRNIKTPVTLKGANIETHLDHRIAMSFALASLVAEGETVIDDETCVNISYPTFFADLKSLEA